MRVARKENKEKGKEIAKEDQQEKPKAKAQEPLSSAMIFSPDKQTKHVTLNVRGTNKPGAKDIDILCLTEARSNQNSRETMRQHTWCFSVEGGRKEHAAGVGIAVGNNFMQ